MHLKPAVCTTTQLLSSQLITVVQQQDLIWTALVTFLWGVSSTRFGKVSKAMPASARSVFPSVAIFDWRPRKIGESIPWTLLFFFCCCCCCCFCFLFFQVLMKRSYIFLSFQQITLKLSVFTNFIMNAFFLAVLTDFFSKWPQSKVE